MGTQKIEVGISMLDAETPRREAGIEGVTDFRFMDGLRVDDRRPLFALLMAAHDVLPGHKWVDRILGFWFGMAVPDSVGVFLYKIFPIGDDVPEYHWVVVGPNIPSAYISVEGNVNPQQALEGYIEVIRDWIEAINSGACETNNYYPVEVPVGMTAKVYAEHLTVELARLEREVLKAP